MPERKYTFMGQYVDSIPEDEVKEMPDGSWYYCAYYCPMYHSHGIVKHEGYAQSEAEAQHVLATTRRN